MKMTNAIRFHDYGGPEVMSLEQIPCPVPKDDEILVRVHAMGVNPVDWKLREGIARKRINIPLPAIPGGDISGVIEQVGRSTEGVSVGQPVFAMVGLLGAYTEHVAIKPGIAAPKPVNLDHVQAASVPLAALTAWKGLFELGGLQRGQRVLIHAAAGGVGSFAVQLASNAGAHVVGTASSTNAAYLRELGAGEVIDYRKDSFNPYAHSFDVVLDLISGETGVRSLQLLKRGGIHVGVLPPPEPLLAGAEAAGLRTAAVQVAPDGARLREIGGLIEAGKVRTSVAKVFPLEQAAQAHEESKQGHTRGKIVLTAIA
jgi:NADPH:quinone reductase-like Zn-dependent oxidoreductase